MQFTKPRKTKKLVIIGDSLFAEVAHEHFMWDSEYEVVGFAVEPEYKKQDMLLGLPVIALEELKETFPADSHEVYAALVSTQLNRLRARLMQKARQMGYSLASYISSQAIVWPNAKIGEHCFIFENNVVQPFVTIGDNVVLWSGNHIGHHSRIDDHVFVSSHVVVSGSCHIGAYSFIGVNTAIANDLVIGADSFLNLASVVTKPLEGNAFYRGQPAASYREDARSYFKVDS